VDLSQAEAKRLHSIMTTTRAAVYDRDGSITVKELPLAAPGPGELGVRITACGICPGEVLGWYVARKAPFVLGHEPVGVVESCGDGAAPSSDGSSPFKAGERVFIHHHAPCMQCRYCQRGDHVQCAAWRASKLVPGGMASRAIVPADNVRADVLRLPDDVDDDTATLIEPLATVVKSVRRSRVRSGDRVLVLGLGVMGLLHVALMRRRGAGLVLGADRVPARLECARRMGAHDVIDIAGCGLEKSVHDATDGDGADVVIVGPGSAPAMESASATVARGGTIVLFTPLPADERWPLPVHDFYFKDVTVTTSYSAGPPDTREALELLKSGFDVQVLFTHRFNLDSVNEAYRLVAEARDALKVVVYPNGVTEPVRQTELGQTVQGQTELGQAVLGQAVLGQASLAQPQ
jgi:L-iditol 2-dehydrogenase